MGDPSTRLDTLPTTGTPRLTLGWAAIAWAERWLVQPNGPQAGAPFRFTPRQGRFLLHWYAVDDDGRWLWQRAVRRLAKGSGKSPSAAVLALIGLAGPSQVHDIDGDHVEARPTEMPLVQIAATSEAQTANTMRMVRAFLRPGSPLREELSLDVGKTRVEDTRGGRLEVITASATAAEGAESSLVVADETEHWLPSNGGVALASTLLDNLGKSASRMIETCNAWIPGRDSVAESTWEAWCEQERGAVRDGADRILYDAVVARRGVDLADREQLLAELGRVYADCPWVDPLAIAGRIWSPTAKPEESLRKYLNRPERSAQVWIQDEDWSACSTGQPVTPGDSVALGFDGSRTGDATALVACRIGDGHLSVLGVWQPEPGSPVPVDEVDEAVRAAIAEYDVRAFFADVREWESHTQRVWPGYLDAVDVRAVPGGRDPQTVAWDMRTHTRDFARAVDLVAADAAQRRLSHDGSPVLAAHVRHAVPYEAGPYGSWGTSLRKAAPTSPDKIDAAVAAVIASHARRLVLSSPGWAKRVKRLAVGRQKPVFV